MHAVTAQSKEEQKDPTKDNQSDPTALFLSFGRTGVLQGTATTTRFDATYRCSLHTAERSFAAHGVFLQCLGKTFANEFEMCI